ncbi:MAG: hypothetical protein Q4B26_03825 [Eubacteriales bacterium]|nr:hypothetical protein [Eubacteriales bacterium]
MKARDVLMKSGEIFDGNKISELADYIIDKFAEERLSRDEAIEVLEYTKEITGEYAIVQKKD